jgi:hypothetical protein
LVIGLIFPFSCLISGSLRTASGQNRQHREFAIKHMIDKLYGLIKHLLDNGVQFCWPAASQAAFGEASAGWLCTSQLVSQEKSQGIQR